MMNTMMNCSTATSDNYPFAVKIVVDKEMIEALKEHFHQNCMALKNEDFGFGVWFTEGKTLGVYSDDIGRKPAISLYWDENAEAIKQAFEDAETFEEAIEVAYAVILGTIIDILKRVNESEAC